MNIPRSTWETAIRFNIRKPLIKVKYNWHGPYERCGFSIDNNDLT